MDEAEPAGADVRLRVKYRRIAMVLLVIAILFTLWTVAIIVSIFWLGADAHWAVASPIDWVATNLGVVGLFLFINILLYMRYQAKTAGIRTREPRVKRRRRLRKKAPPAPEMMKGHEVHTLTLPTGAKGGIFSKTFVPIDDHRVLQLRYQMIPPAMLWPPKTE